MITEEGITPECSWVWPPNKTNINSPLILTPQDMRDPDEEKNFTACFGIKPCGVLGHSGLSTQITSVRRATILGSLMQIAHAGIMVHPTEIFGT